MYCTLLYCTVLYCSVLYCAVLYNAVIIILWLSLDCLCNNAANFTVLSCFCFIEQYFIVVCLYKLTQKLYNVSSAKTHHKVLCIPAMNSILRNIFIDLKHDKNYCEENLIFNSICSQLCWTVLRICTILLLKRPGFITVLYCTVPYCTVLYCTVLYCTVLSIVLGCVKDLYYCSWNCLRIHFRIHLKCKSKDSLQNNWCEV